MEHINERQPNPEQASVINDLENNIILFASAGTGKTFTVAKRIQGILASGRAAPEEILCLTFTNRACEEMVEDIGQYVGEEARRICIKTIHGFCLWLVKQEAKLRNASYTEPDICDDADEEDLLYDLLLDCGNRWEIERVLTGHGKTLKDYENGQTIYDKDSDTLFVAVDRRLCVSPTGEESTPDVERRWRTKFPFITVEEILIPTVEIASGAREIVHYDIDEMIRTRGIDAAEGYRRFSEFVKGAVLVGHNSARFDHAVVSRQLRELGLPPLDVRAEYDTLELAKLFRPSLKNYKLATIIESIGVTNEAAHDAMGDIKATASVLVDLVEHGVIPTGAEREKLLAKHKNKFEKFRAFLAGLSQILADGDVTQLVDEVIHTCKLDSKGKDEATRRHAQKAIADVRDMIAGAQYDDARDFVQSFLINASLSGSQINYLIRNLNQIPLITVHQSKGCEFDTVLIAGADNKSFPTKRAKTPEQINEEKRVFYVAISRAKKRLLLYCAVKASPYKVYSAPSPYLFKLPPETLDWTEYVAPASESCIERLQAQDPDAFRNATILPMAEIVRR